VRGRTQIALSLCALAACVLAVAFSAASFTDSETNPQTATAIADWVAPSVTASVIANTSGGSVGYVKAKGSYYVYAQVVESGNPASGTESVKADLSSITSGASAVTLKAGSYTVGGVSYSYRSESQTAGSGTGAKSYALALSDKAHNSSSQSFSGTVLGSFAGGKLETSNASGGNEGKPEQGDTVTFTYDNPPEPSSIVAGWTGSTPVSVSVTITQSSSNDTLSFASGSLGTVELKGNYVSKTVAFSNSSLTLSGNAIVLTLGSPAASSSLEDDNSSRQPVWKPSSSARDLADNACATTSVTAGKELQF